MERSKEEQLRANANVSPVPHYSEEIKENFTITTNTASKASKEQIINQAFRYHSEGNISQAAKYYQYFINQGFNHHGVFYNYAVILKSFGNLKDAEILYQKAIRLKPDFAEAHSSLGNIFKDLGKLKEAESCQRKAIKLKPDFAEAYSYLGCILQDRKQPKEAEISHRKAIEINPNLAIAHQKLGETLIKIGRLKEAKISTLKAIQIDPYSIDSHRNLEHIKIEGKEFHNMHCIFCGEERKCKIIKSNTYHNRYTQKIISSDSSQSKQINRRDLFSRLCFRCSHCGSQFYNPSLSDDQLDKMYNTKPVFHNTGWWSFYKSQSNPDELFLKEKKKINKILNLVNDYISNRVGIYCEVNCPFQGIINTFNFNSEDIDFENNSLSEKFRNTERILAIEPSKEIWGNECQFTLNEKDQQKFNEKNKIIKCREKAISSKLFHSILNFNSELFINKVKGNKNSTNIVLFANTLDHLPNPLLSLSKSIQLFDLVLVTLHTYDPKEGPSMQHKMQIGNLYSNWKNLIKIPCEIYDLSKALSINIDISQDECDRLILIKKK